MTDRRALEVKLTIWTNWTANFYFYNTNAARVSTSRFLRLRAPLSHELKDLFSREDLTWHFVDLSLGMTV